MLEQIDQLPVLHQEVLRRIGKLPPGQQLFFMNGSYKAAIAPLENVVGLRGDAMRNMMRKAQKKVTKNLRTLLNELAE